MVRLVAAVFAIQIRCGGTVESDDLMATKVWLDKHVFNSTLKTTSLPSGQKAFMTSLEKAKENGIENWPPAEWPTLCFLGLGPQSITYLATVTQLFPELQIVLMEVEDERWLVELDTLLGKSASRVERGRIEEFHDDRGASRRICQAISWSVDTPPFSFYRYRHLFYSSPFVLALFNMNGCTLETKSSEVDKYYCEYLYTAFQTTLCGRLKENGAAEYNGEDLYFPMVDTGCGTALCLCNAHSDAFADFHLENMCRAGDPVHRFQGQWGQDRFLMENVFGKNKKRGEGVYVDVGASHPYHLSNTAYFDQCLGWRGVCMEPNPRSKPILKALRSCEVVSACAWANRTTMRFANGAELAAMTDDETLLSSTPYEMDPENIANTYFEAVCAPLHELLVIGLQEPHRRETRPVIDLISIDAEGAEIEILKDFPFELWDIRTIVIETSRRTSMAIDGLLLPFGFIKIAVLGKDAVYVSRTQVDSLPSSPVLPERIMWNEPGTDEEWTEYFRFQRLFGVTGDLDVDVGDQRLLNETELERQAQRLDVKQNASRDSLLSAAREASLGGILTEDQREKMQRPEIQEALRDNQVKAATAVLLSDEGGRGEAEFLKMVHKNERLKAKVIDLLKVGVLVHTNVSVALGIQDEIESDSGAEART